MDINKELSNRAVFIGKFENQSEDWLAARNEFGAVGGSDIGTIAGWNKWESAITRWAKKSGLVEDSIEPSHRMRMGTKFEDDIIEIFAEDHPDWEVFTDLGTWGQTANPLNRANPDFMYVQDGELCLGEVKFMSDNATTIPLSYRAQMLWYMGIFGIKRGMLVACAGSNYVELPLEFDQFEFDTLVDLADRFRHHLETGLMPDWDGSNSTYETVRALHPNIDPDEVEELGDLGMHLVNAYNDFQVYKEKYTMLQSITLNAMGKAKWGMVDGVKIVYRTSRNGGAPYLAFKKGDK